MTAAVKRWLVENRRQQPLTEAQWALIARLIGDALDSSTDRKAAS